VASIADDKRYLLSRIENARVDRINLQVLNVEKSQKLIGATDKLLGELANLGSGALKFVRGLQGLL
jgi:hypothetical protein